MANPNDPNKSDPNKPDAAQDRFLFPRGRYHGEFTPENLAFNSNLQEFAQRVAFLCNLETGGKISPQEAYDEIKSLWAKLGDSKAQLLDLPRPEDPEYPEE